MVWRSEPAAPEPPLLVGMRGDRGGTYALGRTKFFHIDSEKIFGRPPGTLHSTTPIHDRGAGSVHFVRVNVDVGFVAWDRTRSRVRLEFRTCSDPGVAYERDEYEVLAFDGCVLLPPDRAALPGSVPVAFSLRERQYEEDEGPYDLLSMGLRPRWFAVVDGAPVASDGAWSFSPDRGLVLRGHGTTLALADVASRATLCQADAGPHPIMHLAWSAAVRTVITADAIGGLTVWTIEPPA